MLTSVVAHSVDTFHIPYRQCNCSPIILNLGSGFLVHAETYIRGPCAHRMMWPRTHNPTLARPKRYHWANTPPPLPPHTYIHTYIDILIVVIATVETICIDICTLQALVGAAYSIDRCRLEWRFHRNPPMSAKRSLNINVFTYEGYSTSTFRSTSGVPNKLQ